MAAKRMHATALALCVTVAVVCGVSGKQPGPPRGGHCPKGLQCASGPSVPQAQPATYLGQALACLFSDPSPPPVCSDPYGVFFALSSQRDYNGLLETPLAIRFIYHNNAVMANALTAFHPTALPYAYAPGYGLPYAQRISGEANNTCNKNLAMAWAVYTFVKLVPTPQSLIDRMGSILAGLTSPPQDLSYNGTNNLLDPRDIGIAAGRAVHAYGLADGWDELGTTPDGPFQAQPYSDYSNFVPANTPYELKDITKWQPLLEDNRLGYFVAQTHVAVQIRANKVQPFSGDAATFYAKYNTTDPYPKVLDDAALAAYKAQADVVLQTQAGLNDTQKMVTELFDSKINGFAATPLRYWAKPGALPSLLSQEDFVNLAAYGVAILYDATLAMWSIKPKINAVRPASAIRYLYANTNVSAWAGPFKGTKTILGRQYNSYLRTMPHADYPSGTACICAAWATFTERYLGVVGNPIGSLPFFAKFPQGCSFVEPGAVPASTITFSSQTTQEFIDICSQTRLWAGVHFQQSIDEAKRICPGIGIDGYNKYVNLRNGISS